MTFSKISLVNTSSAILIILLFSLQTLKLILNILLRSPNINQLQSFLGLANYYWRFITGFAKISHPFNLLLPKKKNTKFVLVVRCSKKAFDELIFKISSSPVLLPFRVDTDCTNFPIGTILSQISPKDNKVHPVAFFSGSPLLTKLKKEDDKMEDDSMVNTQGIVELNLS